MMMQFEPGVSRAHGRGQSRGRGRGLGRGRGRCRTADPIPEPVQVESATVPIRVPEAGASQQHESSVPSRFESDLVELLRRAVGIGSQPMHHVDRRIQIYEMAKKVGAQEFTGAVDPFEADDWLRQLMKVFAWIDCSEEDRVACAVLLLKGDADIWWANLMARLREPRDISWEFFEQQFRDRYLPEVYKERQIKEFLTLTQGDQTVHEYQRRFLHLERFAVDLFPTEADRCRKFIKGLHVSIRPILLAGTITTFNVLVGKALDVEEAVREGSELSTSQLGKRDQPSGSRSRYDDRKKKKRFGDRLAPKDQQRRIDDRCEFRQTIACRQCGRFHQGVCHQQRRGCFRCEDLGHFIRDCPQIVLYSRDPAGAIDNRANGQTQAAGVGTSRETTRSSRGGRGGGSTRGGRGGDSQMRQSTQARVYAITRYEAPEATDVVTGIRLNF